MKKQEKEKAGKEVDRQLEEKTIPVPEELWEKILHLSELMEVDSQARTDRDYDREAVHAEIWEKHSEIRSDIWKQFSHLWLKKKIGDLKPEWKTPFDFPSPEHKEAGPKKRTLPESMFEMLQRLKKEDKEVLVPIEFIEKADQLSDLLEAQNQARKDDHYDAEAAHSQLQEQNRNHFRPFVNGIMASIAELEEAEEVPKAAMIEVSVKDFLKLFDLLKKIHDEEFPF